MFFKSTVDQLLSVIQQVFGAVDRKKKEAILSHLLLKVEQNGCLSVIASDAELELRAYSDRLLESETGEITVDAKKLFDICRTLPKEQNIFLIEKDQKIKIESDRSKFNLLSLAPQDFPLMQSEVGEIEFNIHSETLVSLLNTSHFAAANTDVRYFLKGVLLKTEGSQLTFTSMDGHRLATTSCTLNATVEPRRDIILPRKTVQEILRLFSEIDTVVTISVSRSYIRLEAENFSMCSTLIQGQYPDYQRLIAIKGKNELTIDRDFLKEALLRVSVLNNDKYRGIRFQLRENALNIIVLNPEQERAEELLTVIYQGESFDVGFNISYVLDILNHVPEGSVSFYFSSAKESALITSSELSNAKFLIMPMRL